jgi:rare lipoprotein A
MSKLFSALLTLAVVGFLAASPARAAWTCIGPEHACSTKGSSKSLTKYASKSKASYAQRKKASKSTYSYSGGGSTGIASYYWQGTRTASGARFNPGGLTAAHRSLPFGTRVRVTNLSNGRSVTVTINDRGPFIKGRVIDLSRGAASVIGMTGSGIARVSYSVVGRG